ncbi:MAG: hypothetical protein IT384_28565 [Deltaproteobacteria bacterium]|nr:hypothetical protein [Deltaproteobacteria bacterium]
MRWQRIMMITMLMSGLLLSGAIDPALVGSWGGSGSTVLTLKADGTGALFGQPFEWSAADGALHFTSSAGADQTSYQVSERQLVIIVGQVPMTLERVGKAPRGARAAGTQPRALHPSEPVAGTSNDPLARLLLSSAWCSFSYSKITGATNTKRIVYAKDGTWALLGQHEMVSSGPNGTAFAASNDGNRGRWSTEGGQLRMSQGASALVLVPLQINRNSSGYPIITANGVEWAMCR